MALDGLGHRVTDRMVTKIGREIAETDLAPCHTAMVNEGGTIRQCQLLAPLPRAEQLVGRRRLLSLQVPRRYGPRTPAQDLEHLRRLGSGLAPITELRLGLRQLDDRLRQDRVQLDRPI